jgi:hypothetical protein
MIETEANYISGIVDGEGTISITKYNNINNSYRPDVLIPNTNLNLLKYIRDISKIGYIYERPKQKDNWKICYIYRLRKHEYKKFLIPILPYLIIKKRQAELVLQYVSLRKGHKYYPLTIEEIEVRENIYDEIKPLNERGQKYLHEVEKFPKLNSNLKELTKGSCAYLAAIIDSEGCIFINKNRDGYYKPHINIRNTNIDLIHYIQILTNIGFITNETSETIHKNSYLWNLYVHQMKDFLIKTKPYLKIKNQQCDLLLEYFQLKGERRINELTNQEKITLELIYDDIKVLNKRGN